MADNSPESNTYILDPESPTELGRLINLDRFITKSMGGPLAGLSETEIEKLHVVLDLACGPGSWVLDVAFAYPEAEVAGVDISESMIAYANARARTQRRFNASFGVMDITQLLDFSDNSFDLINARFLVGVLYSDAWRRLIAECTRLLRPGGILRLTEPSDIDPETTTSEAFNSSHALFTQAMCRAGYGFSSDGRAVNLMRTLPQLLQSAGYGNIQQVAYEIEIAQDTEVWADYYRNFEVGGQMMQSFAVKTGMYTQEEVEKAYRQVLLDLLADDFRATQRYTTLWGTKL